MWCRRSFFLLRSVTLGVLAVGCYAPSAATQVRLRAESLPLRRFRNDSVAFATFSGVMDSMRVVIRDRARWREYWARIHSPFVPAPSEPEIDFDREMVIVAALGRRPSLGYDILIRSATLDSAGIEVQLRRSKPAQGCPVGAAVTEPVDLARIPASDLRVRFTELITATPCGER
jgi:hypothetical protein